MSMAILRRRTERPVAQVPGWIVALLAVAFAAQLVFAALQPPAGARAEDLPAPPGARVLGLAAFGEPVALGKLLMLWLQAFDYRSGTQVPYRNLDYGALAAWLEGILMLDPSGQYPLMAASNLYAEVPDPVKVRLMLDLVYRAYLVDPNQRWPWMAHATILAKHRLHDLPLALLYARALERHTTAPDVPVWVTQMQAFIMEDMDELEAAKIIIGGIIASGRFAYPQEEEMLKRRLAGIEERLREEKRLREQRGSSRETPEGVHRHGQ
jgi:hypothetical protein